MTIQINPREIAAEALVTILKEEGYNTTVLQKILRQNGAMSKKDRAFVTELVNGCLRNLYYIDFVINNVSKLKTEKMKPWILAVLHTAVYQFFFMNVPEKYPYLLLSDYRNPARCYLSDKEKQYQ